MVHIVLAGLGCGGSIGGSLSRGVQGLEVFGDGVHLLLVGRLRLIPGSERQAVEHICVRISQLLLYDVRLGSGLDGIVCQGAGVAHGPAHGGLPVRPGNAHDLEFRTHVAAVVQQLQPRLGGGQVGIGPGALIILVVLRREDELKGGLAQLFIAPGTGLLLHALSILQGGESLGHLVVAHQPQGIQHQVGYLVVLVHEEDDLIIALRPLAVEQVVSLLLLLGNQLPVLAGKQFIPYVHALIHGAHGVEVRGIVSAVHGRHSLLHQTRHIAFHDGAVLVLIVDVKLKIISIPDGGQVRDTAASLIQPGLEVPQVVGHGLCVEHGVH